MIQLDKFRPSFRSQKKIFCIGFNKTGTSSLHGYFRSAGLKSQHVVKWTVPSNMPTGQKYFHEFQCYSDGEKSNFVNLHAWFPQALFILNTRDERGWLISRIKHVMRYNDIPPKSGLMERSDYGQMAKDFFFDPEASIMKWILEKRIYEAQVRTYFSDKDCFLELNVIAEKDWGRKLHDFLSSNGVAHAPVDKEVHANRRDKSQLSDQAQLARYINIMDQCLARQGDMSNPLS